MFNSFPQKKVPRSDRSYSFRHLSGQADTPTYEPVSYTHLDVYKRQMLAHAASRLKSPFLTGPVRRQPSEVLLVGQVSARRHSRRHVEAGGMLQAVPQFARTLEAQRWIARVPAQSAPRRAAARSLGRLFF